MEIKSRFEWADNLRFFATISVIILHVASTALYFFNKIPLSHWLIADLTDSAMRFCVPLFLMISGGLLLRENHKPIEFFKKRVTRVIFPFIFWSLIYSVTVFVYYSFTKDINISFIESVENFIFYKENFRQIAYHLWYVYTIIGIYLITPFIRNIFAKQGKKPQLHFILIWLIIIILNADIFNFSELIKSVFKFFGFTCYFIAGYYLSNMKRFISKKIKIILWILVGFLILFTAVATYLITVENNGLDEEFFKYMSPNIILMSLLIFILISDINIKNGMYLKTREAVNKYSYGIFLSHVLVLWVLEKAGFGWSFIHPLVGIPLGSLLTLSISFGIIFLLNKIPLIKRVAG